MLEPAGAIENRRRARILQQRASRTTIVITSVEASRNVAKRRRFARQLFLSGGVRSTLFASGDEYVRERFSIPNANSIMNGARLLMTFGWRRRGN